MQGETTMKLKDMTPMAGLMVAACFVALTLSPTTAVAGESKRDRQLHLTKECSTYGGAAGDHCTIIASDFNQIAIGSKIFYDQAAGTPSGLLDSNVLLDAGSGRAVGRCTLDLGTGLGLCTFSDGTGSFNGFQARLDVTCNPQFVCRLDGTFTVDSKDDR
jgi:hypothetical protein